MKSHKDLDVWKRSIVLVTAIYRVTDGFPKHEMYGLTSQIRRAAVSIPSNIAEGAARSSNRDFIRFLYISLGSLAEVETQVVIAANLEYIPDAMIFESDIVALKQMLRGLIAHLGRRD